LTGLSLWVKFTFYFCAELFEVIYQSILLYCWVDC